MTRRRAAFVGRYFQGGEGALRGKRISRGALRACLLGGNDQTDTQGVGLGKRGFFLNSTTFALTRECILCGGWDDEGKHHAEVLLITKHMWEKIVMAQPFILK